eukprot:TRINITY_DN7228_c0_g1_i1.p1 TRINITY_DN7228_c0_g1~~TRINITY_DN7228_c0_g1_i1.p1  ORF type:complete len:180 (-),score=56.18 TRINITY_DN7228_c0_g1_i1:265-804(-)
MLSSLFKAGGSLTTRVASVGHKLMPPVAPSLAGLRFYPIVKHGIIPRTQKASAFPKGTEINRTVACTGGFGLRAQEFGHITEEQLDAARKGVRRILKAIKTRGAVFGVRVKTYMPMTKKPAEVRMGSGKGSKVDRWVYPCRPGKVIFELRGVSSQFVDVAFKDAASKLPLKTRVIRLTN